MTTKFPIRFGKYLLLEKISMGGMAEVFRAKSFGVAGFEKSFALKRILPHISKDPEFVAMFIDEAKIAARLHHANICQIVEFGRVEDSYFQAMEYIPGADTRKIRRTLAANKRPVPPEIAIYIVERVCDGLDYAHRKKGVRGESLGIVHRDVSPQNILVSFEGGVKLIDFGIAKAADRAAKTQAGQIKGKFSYLAPEQITGQQLDGKVDIFALGVVFWEMLTGKDLFVADSEMEILRMIIRGDVPSPSRINPSLPRDLDSLVLQALATNPEDRYMDAGVFHEEIQRVAYKLNMKVGTSVIQNFMTNEFAEDLQKEQEKVRQFLDMSKEMRLPDDPYEESVQRKQSDPVSVVTFSGKRLLPKTQRPQQPEPADITVIQGLSRDSDIAIQTDMAVSAEEDIENILELDDADLVEIQEEKESQNYSGNEHRQQDGFQQDFQHQDDYRQEYLQPDDYQQEYQQPDDYQQEHLQPDDYQQEYRQPDDYQQEHLQPDDYQQEHLQPDDYQQEYRHQQDECKEAYGTEDSQTKDNKQQISDNQLQDPLEYSDLDQREGFGEEPSITDTKWISRTPHDFDGEDPTKAMIGDDEMISDDVGAICENNFQRSENQHHDLRNYNDIDRYDSFEEKTSLQDAEWAGPNPDEFDDEEPTRATIDGNEIGSDDVAAIGENKIQEMDSSMLEAVDQEDDVSYKEDEDEDVTMFDPTMKPLKPHTKEPEDLESKDGEDWSIQFNSPDDPVE